MDPTDVGTLLTSSGFKMPTVDVEDVKIGYADAYTLMRHLGGMGESNAGVGKVENGQGDYDTFLAASCLYREMFGELGEEGDDILGQEEEGEGEGEEGGGGGYNYVPATFQIIYGIGWKNHESQQQPDERGSAQGKIGFVEVEKS